MTKPLTFWQQAQRFPPILVRLLARHKNGPPLTTEEISRRSGISEYYVSIISQCFCWDEIPVGKMRSFLVACGIDFCDPVEMHRKKSYLRRPRKFHYLTQSPEWHNVLRPLAEKFRNETVQRP